MKKKYIKPRTLRVKLQQLPILNISITVDNNETITDTNQFEAKRTKLRITNDEEYADDNELPTLKSHNLWNE